MAKHLPDGRGTDQFNDQNKSTGTGINEYDLRPAENRGNEQISSVKNQSKKLLPYLPVFFQINRIL